MFDCVKLGCNKLIYFCVELVFLNCYFSPLHATVFNLKAETYVNVIWKLFFVSYVEHCIKLWSPCSQTRLEEPYDCVSQVLYLKECSIISIVQFYAKLSAVTYVNSRCSGGLHAGWLRKVYVEKSINSTAAKNSRPVVGFICYSTLLISEYYLQC